VCGLTFTPFFNKRTMIAINNNHILKYLKQPLPFAIAKICKEWQKDPTPKPVPTLLPLSKSQPIDSNCKIRSLMGVRLSLVVSGKVDNKYKGFRDLVEDILDEFDNLEYVRGVVRIKA